MYNDGIVTPHPPIIRALNEVRAKLEAAGHEVIEWKGEGKGHDECWNLTQALYYEDGGKAVKDLVARGDSLSSTQSPLIPPSFVRNENQ